MLCIYSIIYFVGLLVNIEKIIRNSLNDPYVDTKETNQNILFTYTAYDQLFMQI